MTEVVKHEDEDGFGEEGFKDAGVEECIVVAHQAGS